MNNHVKVKYVNGNFLCWDALDVMILRNEFRLLGQLIGQLPNEKLAPKAIHFYGLPLYLTPFEVYLGVTEGFLKVFLSSIDINDKFEESLNTSCPKTTVSTAENNISDIEMNLRDTWEKFFLDSELGFKRMLIQSTLSQLWRKGMWIQFSSHLFADFTVYEADPLIIHGSYLIICLNDDQALSATDLSAYSRMANNSKKSILLASFETTKMENKPLVPFEEYPISLIEINWQGVS